MVLAALAVVISLYFMLHTSIVSMLFLSLSLVLIWDFFRNSTVWIAFRAFRRGDSTLLPYLLGQVHWPLLLSKSSRGYYYWMLGVSCLTLNNWQEAKLYLLIAAASDIRTENDRSLIQCMLAESSLQLGAREEALHHLLLAAQLEHHEHVDQVINGLQQRINQRSE